MAHSFSDGFDNYNPESIPPQSSFERFGKGYSMKKREDEPVFVSWNQLAPIPSFWERVKQVFWPKRSPVNLTVGFHFRPEGPGGPAHFDTVEAFCTAPGIVGSYKLELKVWNNGQLMIDPSVYGVMGSLKGEGK